MPVYVLGISDCTLRAFCAFWVTIKVGILEELQNGSSWKLFLSILIIIMGKIQDENNDNYFSNGLKCC